MNNDIISICQAYARGEHGRGALRYSAHTLDGSLIFSADTAQRLCDKVADHIERGSIPHIAYTYDIQPGTFPFTVWKHDGAALVGSPCKTFDEVAQHWGC